MRVESSVPDLAMKNKYVFLIVSHCHTKKGVLATLGQSLKGGAITCNSREKKKRDLKEKVKIKGKRNKQCGSQVSHSWSGNLQINKGKRLEQSRW